jgi:hypothetical protein
VDIPKETAENICRNLSAATGCKVDWHYIGGRVHIKAIAAPVVERQETVAYQWRRKTVNEGSQWTKWVECTEADYHGVVGSPGPSHRGVIRKARKLYAEHPAPVAVVLDERAEFVAWVRREWPQAPLSNVRDLLPKDDPRYGEYCDDTLQRAWVGWQARACLDMVKGLNQ